MSNELTKTLEDIGGGLRRDSWLPHSLRPRTELCAAWDFRVEKHPWRNAGIVFPDSRNALEWLQEKLPDGIDRFGAVNSRGITVHGFTFENPEEAKYIGNKMTNDGLLSFDDYIEAEEEMVRQFEAQQAMDDGYDYPEIY